MSLSDPLTLLRDFTVAKKPVVVKDDHIAFGRTLFDRKAPTAYRAAASGGGGFYSIESLWFLLKHADATHANYVGECGKQQLKAVTLLDKRNLLAFLRGEVESTASIDFANAPAVQPVSSSAEEASAVPRDADAMQVDQAEADLAMEPSEEDKAAKAEERRRLQEELDASKLAFVALLDQPRGNVQVDAAPAAAEAEEAAGEEGAEGAAKTADDAKAAKAKAPRAFALGDAKLYVRDKAGMTRTRAIVKKEQKLRSRKSVLLAQNTATFPLITQILDGFRKRNKAALEQEEHKRRAEHQKKQGGGSTSLSKPPGASSSSSKPPGAAAAAPPLSRAASSSGSSPRHRGEAVAIIVVPATLTYLVNMWNVRELLEEQRLVDCMEKKASGAAKPASIKIRHTFEDGSSCNFVVTDNPLALKTAEGTPVACDWGSLVAVFAAGTTWQFKGWPFKDPTELFNKVQGYHVRYFDEKPNQVTKAWPVEKLVVSKQKTKRHEVSVMAMKFWSSLHTHLARHKPHMLTKPLERQQSF